MGWLEELGKGAGYGTLGKLAVKAVEAPDWPDAESRHPRTVENLLRELDRGSRKGQVWLDKRPAVREVLADLLSVSPESLDAGLVEDGPAERRIVLQELREARPIDLRKEPLYPGIPGQVFDPGTWGRSWWVAAAGAGKTIVGKWLEARQLATVLRCVHLDEALERLPEGGTIYIELTGGSWEGADRFASKVSGRSICVAAPYAPAAPAEGTPTDGGEAARRRRKKHPSPKDEPSERLWNVIESPAKPKWEEALVRWVGQRMRPGGGFEVEAMLRYLAENDWTQLLSTPGDYIGLCGVFEELGADRLEKCTEEQVITSFLRSRIERVDLGGPTGWKPEDLWRLICGCAEGALVHSGQPDTFPSEQSLREWLPPDSLPVGDDSVLLGLKDNLPSDMESVKAVVARASPSPEGAIRELHRLHLLESCGKGSVALRPRWLALVAAGAATWRLIHSPERGLGEILLQPKVAIDVLIRLRDLFHASLDTDEVSATADVELGWSLVQRVVRELDVQDPASVVMLEATFQAVGIALLDQRAGARLPELRALWDAQMRLAVPRYVNNPPRPMLFTLDRENAGGWVEGWSLACLSVSERLQKGGVQLQPSALAPWSEDVPLPDLDPVFHSLERTCRMHSQGGWWSGNLSEPVDFHLDGWRVAGRLYEACGRPPSPFSAREVWWPFLFLDALQNGGAAPDSVAFTPYLWEVLYALAADRNIGMESIFSSHWVLERAAGQRPGSELSGLPDEDLGVYWRQLPPERLKTTLRHLIWEPNGLAWDRLLPEHWEAVLDVWKADETHHTLYGVELLPPAQARAFIERRLGGAFRRDSYDVIWRHHPEISAAEAIREVVSPLPTGTPEGVLWRTPLKWVGTVTQGLRRLFEDGQLSAEQRLLAVRWTHHQCANRGPHWREAWRLLVEIEAVERTQRSGTAR